jgi:hypothetical protein
VEVRFQPPCGHGEVVALGQVVWRREFGKSNATASPPGMGVQFTEWAPADRAAYETGYGILLKEQEAMENAIKGQRPDSEEGERL